MANVYRLLRFGPALYREARRLGWTRRRSFSVVMCCGVSAIASASTARVLAHFSKMSAKSSVP